MGRYAIAGLEQLEGEGPSGDVRKVRRALGARAFLPRKVRHAYAAHFPRAAISSTARRGVAEGEEVELVPGRFVRVDQAATRMPVAGDESLKVLTIGAPLDGRYEPPAWG
jgi:hypothetical protein